MLQVVGECIVVYYVFVVGCLLVWCVGGEYVGWVVGCVCVVRIFVVFCGGVGGLLCIGELLGGQCELQVCFVVGYFFVDFVYGDDCDGYCLEYDYDQLVVELVVLFLCYLKFLFDVCVCLF